MVLVTMKGSSKILLWLMMVLLCTRCSECREPVLHRVGGGKYAWSPNVNYSEWSSRETFYAGDWLFFGFDKHLYNVLEVNEISYENCIDKDFIKNITQGGRDVFQLAEAKPYYFICGGGYCFHGMKLAVYVRDIPPTSSPIRVSNGGHPSSSCREIVLLVVLVLVAPLLWGFLF